MYTHKSWPLFDHLSSTCRLDLSPSFFPVWVRSSEPRSMFPHSSTFIHLYVRLLDPGIGTGFIFSWSPFVFRDRTLLFGSKGTWKPLGHAIPGRFPILVSQSTIRSSLDFAFPMNQRHRRVPRLWRPGGFLGRSFRWFVTWNLHVACCSLCSKLFHARLPSYHWFSPYSKRPPCLADVGRLIGSPRRFSISYFCGILFRPITLLGLLLTMQSPALRHKLSFDFSREIDAYDPLDLYRRPLQHLLPRLALIHRWRSRLLSGLLNSRD